MLERWERYYYYLPRDVIVDGQSLTELGARILEISPYVRPAKRVEQVQIPGRSGSLTFWDGAYDDVKYTIKLTCFADQVDFIDALQSGRRVTFSTQPEYEFSYRVDEEVPLERLLAWYHTATITLLCNPFRRERKPKIFERPGKIENRGNVPCSPTIKIQGAGDFTVTLGVESITLQGVKKEVLLDGEHLRCVVDGVEADHKMIGDFFTLGAGLSADVSVSPTCSYQVAPNWRWI